MLWWEGGCAVAPAHLRAGGEARLLVVLNQLRAVLGEDGLDVRVVLNLRAEEARHVLLRVR